jgi:hypothetical protein
LVENARRDDMPLVTATRRDPVIVRIYEPVPNSPFAWARQRCAVVYLQNGDHVHALPDRNGVLKIIARDIVREKISKEEAGALDEQFRIKVLL